MAHRLHLGNKVVDFYVDDYLRDDDSIYIYSRGRMDDHVSFLPKSIMINVDTVLQNQELSDEWYGVKCNSDMLGEVKELIRSLHDGRFYFEF